MTPNVALVAARLSPPAVEALFSPPGNCEIDAAAAAELVEAGCMEVSSFDGETEWFQRTILGLAVYNALLKRRH